MHPLSCFIVGGCIAIALPSFVRQGTAYGMSAQIAPLHIAFLDALPRQSRTVVADDVKLLVGWAADASSLKTQPETNQVIDRGSTFESVRSFSPPTDMRPLAGTYRVIEPPMTSPGYWGLAVEMVNHSGQPVAVLLVNRLFRLPVILHEPIGVATDIVTVAALALDLPVPSLDSAASAVHAALAMAEARNVPLIVCGQSMAGGLAQYQVARLAASPTTTESPWGFMTFNAADSELAVRHLHVDPARVPGLNFVKDEDPGVGPHALLTNRTGLQVYVHADGSGGLTPAGTPIVSAFANPRAHLLGSFFDLDLAKILAGIGALDAPDPLAP